MADAPELQDGQHDDKPKSKLMLIIGAFVVLIVLVTTLAYLFMSGGGESTSPISSKPKPSGLMITFPLPFTGNLAPPDDQYIYTANVTLELTPKNKASELEIQTELGMDGADNPRNKKAKVFQSIQEVLATKSRSEITSAAGREKIRTQIKNELNKYLEKGEVIEVYTVPFVP